MTSNNNNKKKGIKDANKKKEKNEIRVRRIVCTSEGDVRMKERDRERERERERGREEERKKFKNIMERLFFRTQKSEKKNSGLKTKQKRKKKEK